MKIHPIIEKFKQNTILRNFSTMTFCNFAMQFVSILSSMRIARAMLPDIYGKYNVIFVQVGLFVIIAGFGMGLVIIRMIARKPEESLHIIVTATIIYSITTFIAVISLLIYSNFYNKEFSNLILLLMIVNIVLLIFWNMTNHLAFGLEEMGIPSILNLIFTILFVISVYVLPKSLITIITIYSVTVSIQFIKSIIFITISIKKGFFKGKLYPERMYSLGKDIVVQSLPFLWLAILTAFSNQLPILFLNNRSNSTEVGYFSIGLKLLKPLQMMLALALLAIYPHLSRTYFVDKTKFMKHIRFFFIVVVIIGVCGAFILSFFRAEAVYILYGPKYSKACDVLAYRCWYNVFYAIFSFMGTIFSSLDKQKLLAILSTVYTLFALPIFWIGSNYGARGLAIAFLLGAIINMTYHWVIFQRVIPQRFPTKFTLGIFSFLLCAIIISLLIPTSIGIILKLGIFSAITLGLLIVYKINNSRIKIILKGYFA